MAGEAKASTSWTPEQQAAITHRGSDLLISAAAGAGKTAVLVERVIKLIIEDGVDVEDILVVTFTDAAAAEMKARLAGALQKALAAIEPTSPLAARLAMQAALLDRASISTIHAFCLGVVRRNFHHLGLDPSFKVMDENEAALLLQDTVEQLFEDLYDRADGDRGFLELVDVFGSDRGDENLQTLVIRLYNDLMKQDDPDRWLDEAVGRMRGAGEVAGTQRFEDTLWFSHARDAVVLVLQQAASYLRQARREAGRPDGPGHYRKTLDEDLVRLEGAAAAAARAETWDHIGDLVAEARVFGRLPGRAPAGVTVADERRQAAQDLRNEAKKQLAVVFGRFFAGAGGDEGESESTRRTSADLMREIAATAPYLEKLAGVVRDLGKRFTAAKAARSQVDFADLEHLALRALGGPRGDLSEAARELRARYQEVLVDEYQDVNGVQNAILERVARREPGKPGNLFMVGDVKQSIYRFRLADPGLFLGKYRRFERLDPAEVLTGAVTATGTGAAAATGARGDRGATEGGEASGEGGRLLALRANFRSRRQVVDAVNFVFRQIMTASVGELGYDDDAALVHGATCYGEKNEGDDGSHPVEFHLIERGGAGSGPEPGRRPGFEEEEAEEEEEAGGPSSGAAGGPRVMEEEDRELVAALEKEARVAAQRIREMVEGGPGGGAPLQVFDKVLGGFRGVRYRDICLLMRVTRLRANTVVDVLARAGIPSYAELGTGYFRATEIEAMLALLRVIDNPRQDIYLAAVLRSPLVGLSAEELGYIRAAAAEVAPRVAPVAGLKATSRAANYLDAVLAAVNVAGVSASIIARLQTFLARLERWRTAARRGPLSELIGSIYHETGFLAYAGGMPGGQQRQANLRALHDRAREFDNFAHQGLSRFLRFVRRLQDSAGDLGTARALGEAEDVVRIMSIHKSKGLEFPVVFVVDLGKQFNQRDLSGDLLWHKELGFGPKFVDTAQRLRFPTIAQRAISHRLRLEGLAEELRVLYVAMTRAREKLVLVGSVKEVAGQLRVWCERAEGRGPALSDHALASATNCLDWLGPALARHGALTKLAEHAEHDWSDPPPAPVAGDRSEWRLEFWGTPGGKDIPGLGGAQAAAAANWPWEALASLEVDPSGLEGAPPVADKLVAELGRRLTWEYPYLPLSGRAAKVRSAEAKRRLGLGDPETEESWAEAEGRWGDAADASATRPTPGAVFDLNRGPAPGVTPAPRPGHRSPPSEEARQSDAAARGSATHALLRHLDLTGPLDEDGIKGQVEALVTAGRLTAEEAALAQVRPVAAFFRTDLGHRLARAATTTAASAPAAAGEGGAPASGRRQVWRELPFTAGLPATLLHEFPPDFDTALADGEQVVVQGIMDCLFEDEGGVVLLDFKTDRVASGGGAPAAEALAQRYSGQMRLYSMALESALGRAPNEVYLVFLETGEAVRAR